MKRPDADALLRHLGVAPDAGRQLTVKVPGVASQPPAKRNKYGAKPTIYNGVRYDSKAEAARAESLDLMVKGGLILWWLGQPKFRLGCPENVYVSDFLVVHREGVHAEDVKGKETAKFKRDVKLWRAYGPCELWIVRGGKTVEVVHPRRD